MTACGENRYLSEVAYPTRLAAMFGYLPDWAEHVTGRRLIEARVMAEHSGVFDVPAEWDEERVSRHVFRLLVDWADDWDYEDDTIDDDGVRHLREHRPHTNIYVVGENGGVDKSLGLAEWDGWRAEKAAEAWESLTEEERRAIRLRPTSGQLDIFGGEVQ